MIKQRVFFGGLSYYELLIVVAIFGILATVTTPFFVNFLRGNSLAVVEERVVSSIRKAQNYSINKKSDSEWGICFISNTIRIYTGECANPLQKEDFTVPGNVGVSGLTDTTFNVLTGELSNSLSITINSGSESVVVQVNKLGGFTYQ